jgi:two-component system, cell cycle response regulator
VYDRPALSSDALLQDAIRAAARSPDADAALDDLLRLAIDVSDGRAGAVLLWDADRGGLAVAGSRGLGEGEVERLEGAAASAGDPIHAAAHDRVARISEASAGTADGTQVSAWPIGIVSDGVEEPLGALVVLPRTPDTASAGAVEHIGSIADLMGVTVDRARLASDGAERSDWAERVNHSDPLTGLANARTLARVIELEIARAARQQSELCLALFDVDNLAEINQAAGRSAGDDVLREVAAVAAESVRFVDTVARWGGDEFLLVAPGAKGTTVARRIVEGVAARPDIGGRQYTVSAGIARFPTDGTTGDELIEAAQRALRAAQAAGPGTFAEAVASS